MSRNVLPQNYIINEGSVFENFNTPTEWVISDASGVASADTINGVSLVKLTPNLSTTPAEMVKTISVTGLNNLDRSLALEVYLYEEPANYNALWVYISSHGSLGKYITFSGTISDLGLCKGMNRLIIPATSLSLFNGELYTNTMIKLSVRFSGKVAGVTPSIGFSELRIGYKAKPVCMFCFDRVYDSGYTEGVAYLLSKGLKSTLYICPSLVGTTGKITESQISTANAGGCAIGQYPFDWDINDKQSCINILTSQKNWLTSRGYIRGATHVAYPNGACTDAVLSAMAESGMKTGREGDGRIHVPLNNYYVKRHSLSSTITLAAAKKYIDDAIVAGEPVMILVHTLSSSPVDSDWSISYFRALVDYVLQLKIDVLTIDEFYEGLKNPRYRSILVNRT